MTSLLSVYVCVCVCVLYSSVEAQPNGTNQTQSRYLLLTWKNWLPESHVVRMAVGSPDPRIGWLVQGR